MHMQREGRTITSVDEWKSVAPPRSPEHWRSGRSAKECAVAWCGGPAGVAAPEEIVALLDSHPDPRGCVFVGATPEHPIPFDDLRGEPRNADLAAICDHAAGPIAITVEAKADEPFDRYVSGVLADAVDRSAHGTRTNAVQRVEGLAAALLPPRVRLPGLHDLRYQLLTAAAGTLAYAHQMGAARAVLIVHEFVTDDTRDERHERNASDLSKFAQRISGGTVREISIGRLAGPIRVPGGLRFTRPAALYLGKAQRVLRAPIVGS